MPITLPAHAAAALPFVGLTPRWLSAHALVIGCCAPDLAYLFDASRTLSHTFPLGIPCGVAVGFLAFVWCELLIFPVVATLAPEVAYVDVARMLRRTWPGDARDWVTVFAALLIGVCTHIAWDGFTHHGWWPAVAVFDLQHERHATKVAWKVSSTVGSLLVMAFVYARYRGQRFWDVHWLIVAAALTTFAATVATFIIGWRVLPRDIDVPHWPAELLAIRAAFTMTTLWCLGLARLVGVDLPRPRRRTST